MKALAILLTLALGCSANVDTDDTADASTCRAHPEADCGDAAFGWACVEPPAECTPLARAAVRDSGVVCCPVEVTP